MIGHFLVVANLSLEGDTDNQTRSISKDPHSQDIVLLWEEGEIGRAHV